MKCKFKAMSVLVSIFILTLVGCSSQNTSYEEAEIRDVSSYSGTKHIVAHIIIPLGRTVEEVNKTLEKAAIEIGKKTNSKATVVKGYRPQDKRRTGMWTVGRATYVPNGRWEDCDKNDPMSVTVELSTNALYFQKIKPLKTGKGFILKKASGGPIKLSCYHDRWYENDIIAKLPSGTPVTVLEYNESPISSEKLLIRVHVQDEKNNLEGWVPGEEVALMQ
jgi:hypothetical protein